jgi:hypothetical protein
MVRTEMPPLRFRTPETKQLPDNVYLDIITYIFKENGFPAGKAGLSLDNLEKVQILGRNGIQPPPQYALVLSVGCMIRQKEFERISVTSVTDIAPGCE